MYVFLLGFFEFVVMIDLSFYFVDDDVYFVFYGEFKCIVVYYFCLEWFDYILQFMVLVYEVYLWFGELLIFIDRKYFFVIVVWVM